VSDAHSSQSTNQPTTNHPTNHPIRQINRSHQLLEASNLEAVTKVTMHHHRERLSLSLISELYDLEEDAYRLSIREAERIGWGPPAVTLRAVAAHANDALEELASIAKSRHVRIGSFGAVVADTFRRVRDVVVDQLVDHEQAYRRALGTLHRGIDLVHLAHAAATDEGDDALAQWCHRWLHARERLVSEAAGELAWFARHPFFSRLPGVALPAT
jgi:hypothetical protein